MQISKHKAVAIDYTLTNDAGDVIDSSQGGEPLTYVHGVGALIPGLERALEGQVAGHQMQVVIAPEDAYGVRDEALCEDVPRSEFDSFDEVEVGMQFRVPVTDGHLVLTVVKVADDVVTVDGNHELAGETLHFDVTVREVREATEEELHHDPAHDCDCDGH